ncbi:MAG TPA: hypothetical protein VFP80_07475, partial [Thermoanaerobaculia bacterium]|nr:hypothetical protein [Thermoanaerobaculia bacterium]
PAGQRPARLQAIVFAIPLVVLFLAAAVIPIRDYDGRVTWLPKARAIALEGSTAGPFFQGERGLNLHNRYPLLLPLDAATVMRLSNDTRNEAARWLYVLIPIALFVVLRTMLPSPWIAAALPWLGVVAALEGGALAAYSDFALAAFFGLAVLHLLDGDARTAGLFAAFAVLTKNEGLTLAIALLGAAIVTRRFRLWLLVPVMLAEGIVLAWRVRVPAAYDEQYEALLSTLPSKLERVPAALAAIGRHAVSFPEWGIFWVAVAVAAVIAGRRVALPLVAMTLALAAYVAALCVTSWRIEDLAPVAVNRLLLHLLVPAAYILEAALAGRNTEPATAVTPDP